MLLFPPGRAIITHSDPIKRASANVYVLRGVLVVCYEYRLQKEYYSENTDSPFSAVFIRLSIVA